MRATLNRYGAPPRHADPIRAAGAVRLIPKGDRVMANSAARMVYGTNKNTLRADENLDDPRKSNGLSTAAGVIHIWHRGGCAVQGTHPDSTHASTFGDRGS